MQIDEFEFRNKQGEEIEPTKSQLIIYIKGLHKEIKELKKALELLKNKENYFIFVNENTETIDVNYAIVKAKEMK